MSLAYLRHLFAKPEEHPVRPIAVHWAGLPLGIRSETLRKRGLRAMLGAFVSAHGIEQANLGTCATVLRLGPVVVTFGENRRADAQAGRVVRRVADAYQANVDCATAAACSYRDERDRFKAENAELRAAIGAARAMGHRGVA
jgi:hypothetical protein